MCLLPPYLPPSVPVTALVEKLGQWAVTIGKDSSSSKMEKFIRNTFFQLCLCIFSTLITNVLFKKPFPLCGFSLKKSASISILLGYYESFRKKSFFNSFICFQIFQIFSSTERLFSSVSKYFRYILKGWNEQFSIEAKAGKGSSFDSFKYSTQELVFKYLKRNCCYY